MVSSSLIPRPPPLVYNQYNTWKWNTNENREGLGIPIMRMMSSEREVETGGGGGGGGATTSMSLGAIVLPSDIALDDEVYYVI